MTEIINIELSRLDSIEETAKIQRAADFIKEGKTVVFPTETVYGLGANGLDGVAVKKIFIAKGRPADNPLILHISDEKMLENIVTDISEAAKKLMKAFWPGPITLVLHKTGNVPDEVTAGLDTVAVRMPGHPIALRLISAAGKPVAAPSANISGKPSPTEASHVIEDLDNKVDMIIAANNSKIGLESTVIDMTLTPPVLLRPGGITKDQIEAIIGKIEIDKSITSRIQELEAVRSPGMKYRHYSPDAKMILVRGEKQNKIKKIIELADFNNAKGIKAVILATTENLDAFRGYEVLRLGASDDPEEIMANLYQCLRKCNSMKAGIILSEAFGEDELELAISNRLIRAAGYNVIEV
ncbi:MAG: threonylcarbamoyl-AMP synthase [Eubacteriaceae bacterium]|nr:threonylcarbamoyl-AMP synthase [Eubacteriaceae bacterium]